MVKIKFLIYQTCFILIINAKLDNESYTYSSPLLCIIYLLFKEDKTFDLTISLLMTGEFSDLPVFLCACLNTSLFTQF